MRIRRGMTLVELMIVVAIIAIMATLSTVGMTAFVRNARVNGDSEVLASFMRSARLKAIASGCPFVVRFSGQTAALTPGSLVMYRKRNCALAAAADLAQVTTTPVTQDLPINWYRWSDRVTATETTTGDLTNRIYLVGFRPDGSVLTGEQVGVTVTAAAASPSFTMSSVGAPSTDPTRQVIFNADGNAYLKK